MDPTASPTRFPGSRRRLDPTLGGPGLSAEPTTYGAESIQVLEGLEEGAEVVLYSERALSARSRIHVVDNLAGMAR